LSDFVNGGVYGTAPTAVQTFDSREKYSAAKRRESNAVTFGDDYIIGLAGARSGNITFDFTTEKPKLGATSFMIHDNVGSYTFGAAGTLYDFKAADLTGLTGSVYFAFTLVNDTPGAEAVQIRLSLTAAQL
jgi:hypothetical protein